MAHGILLVDDQRDIVRLLRSTLETLKNTALEIFEAPSGEEALLEASRHKIDLLVVDYLLPGINGLELMRKIRASHPDVRVILITGRTERGVRDEMLNAGAMAIFDKPIPLTDFLDVVERALGLTRTIFPAEAAASGEARHARLSDLLANFRQDNSAQAVFLLNERGRVLARAGDLRDTSMEVSLLSALMGIHSAGIKVSRFNRQEKPEAYYVFRGGDHDLLFIPITPLYALLVAGDDLASRQRIMQTGQAMIALRDEVEKSLKSIGVTGELPAKQDESKTVPAPSGKKKGKTQGAPAPEMQALLNGSKKAAKEDEMDTYWDEAAEKHGATPMNPDVITYEQARKMGLTPDEGKDS